MVIVFVLDETVEQLSSICPVIGVDTLSQIQDPILEYARFLSKRHDFSFFITNYTELVARPFAEYLDCHFCDDYGTFLPIASLPSIKKSYEYLQSFAEAFDPDVPMLESEEDKLEYRVITDCETGLGLAEKLGIASSFLPRN